MRIGVRIGIATAVVFGIVIGIPNSAGSTTTTTTAISDNTDPLMGGKPLTYTVTVTNTGGIDASSLSNATTLDASLAYVSSVGTGWACGNAGQVVTCTRATLAPGAAPAITIVATSSNSTASITTASATSGSNFTTSNGNQATQVNAVTRDATSLVYVPASAAEWTTVMTQAGLATGNPTSLYLCQEPSGNLADSIGSNTLTLAGAGHLFQQAVAGWSRLAATTTDGTAGQKWVNSTTSPDAPTTSVLVLAYVRLPTAAPALARDMFMVSSNADLRMNTTGKLRVAFGASSDLVNVSTNTVQPVVMKINNTGTVEVVYTQQEKFIGTYVVPATAHFLSLGGQSTTAGDFGYMYVVEFAGAAAEPSDAQVKSLLQTLGWTIPWS